MKFTLKFCSAIIIASLNIIVACKTTRDRSQTNETAPNEIKQDLSAVLTTAQKTQIGALLDELAAHIGKFEVQLNLRSALDNTLKGCGNTAAQTSTSSLLNATSGIKPCNNMEGHRDAVKKMISSIASMRRSPAFEKQIVDFIDKVLPDVVQSLYKSSENSSRLDPGQIKQIIEQINDVAVRAQTFAARISWKPSFMAATRYLHQIVLSELTKSEPSTIDWELVTLATNAHLDIFPFAPADAAVNPLTVSPKDPLYRTLYGPTPRGAAYWLMLATSSIRIPDYTNSRDSIEIPPHELTYLDMIEKQILLESLEDQAAIKIGLSRLRTNILKLLR